MDGDCCAGVNVKGGNLDIRRGIDRSKYTWPNTLRTQDQDQEPPDRLTEYYDDLSETVTNAINPVGQVSIGVAYAK